MASQTNKGTALGTYMVRFTAVAALILGANPAANAITWNLVGSGSWTATGPSNWSPDALPATGDTVYINNTGTAQVGGTDVAVANRLYLGNGSGQSGHVNMSGGSLTADDNHSYIGNSGTGTFTQTGGTFDIGDKALYIGNGSTGNGQYTLSGGSFTAYHLRVGENGTGLFEHTGGSVTINSQNLVVGRYTTANGTYNLSGSGVLSAPNEYIACWSIGTAGTGTFNQSGGTNTVASNLFIGNGGGSNTGGNGTYTLSAGTLSVGNDILDNGTTGTSNFFIDGLEAAYTLTVSGNDIKVDNFGVGQTSAGSFTHESGLTVTVNNNLSIGAVGVASTYRMTGGTLNVGGNITGGVGSNLYIDATSYGLTVGGGNITVDNFGVGQISAGMFTNTAGLTTTVNNNLSIGASGAASTVRITGGTLNVGGDITGSGTGNLYIDGLQSAYTLTVGGGNIGVARFAVGNNGGSTGEFTLAAGGPTILSEWQYIGYSGTGTFNHTGGTNSVTNGTAAIYVGYGATGIGTYNLSGTGLLQAGYLRVGEKGMGTFNHSGGTVTVTPNDLIVGRFLGSTGIYNLSGSGILSAPVEFVGGRSTDANSDGMGGTGTLNQSGGINTVTNDLYIGAREGAGEYNLSGGTLSINDDVFIGFSSTGTFATGTFNQDEASATSSVSVGDDLGIGWDAGSNGTYTISAGTLDVDGTLFVGNSGTGLFKIIGDQASIELDGYSQNAASTLEFDINGISPINVDGTISLDGLLDIEFLAAPGVGDQYTLFVNDGTDTVSGIFMGMPEGFIFTPLGSNVSLLLSYQANVDGGSIANDVTLSAVPEPSTLLLLLCAASLLARARRRR